MRASEFAGGLLLTSAAIGLGCRTGAIGGSSTGASSETTIAASHLLDGRGNVQRDVVIVVEGSRIARIEPRAGFAGRITHDLSGLTVLPGLIDVHAHIDWHFNAAGRYHTNADGETPEQSMRAAYANMEATLRGGFTTIQSPGSRIDAALRDSVTKGVAVGPRILTSLGQVSGGTPEQLRAAVRQRKEQGADLVKIFASASIRDGGRATMTQEQLDAACGEAKAIGIRTMVHAHSAEAMKYAALAGCDQIEHGVFATPPVLQLMAARGTYFSPQCGLVFRNYLENRAKYEGIGNYNAEGFASMERAVPIAIGVVREALATPGLKVVYGTDAVAGAHGRNANDFSCRVREAGESPMHAIVAATSLSAESMRLGQTIGTLAPGYEADIIAVDGDPLAEIGAMGRVVFVMRAGRVYRNDRGGR